MKNQKRWLVNPNKTVNATNKPRSALTSQTLPPMKNAHLEGSGKNIPKEKESKFAS